MNSRIIRDKVGRKVCAKISRKNSTVKSTDFHSVQSRKVCAKISRRHNLFGTLHNEFEDNKGKSDWFLQLGIFWVR